MKVLFLIRKYVDYFDLLVDEAQKQNLDFQIATFDEVVIKLQTNVFEVLVNGKAIDDYQLVYFRNVERNYEKFILISHYCKEKNIPILDEIFQRTDSWLGSKSFEYMKLSKANLPIIDSIFLSQKMLSQMVPTLTFPCVAKITNGSQGKGVYLCQNPDELDRVFTTEAQPLLIQEYLPNDGDLRIFILNHQCLGAMKRMPSDPTEFRNNVSLGGRGQRYQPSEVEIDLSIRAAQALEYSMAGVDLIWHEKQKKWVIMEVNRAPQYVGLMNSTNINIPQKMIEFFKNYAH